MAQNSSITQLDANQVTKRTFDEANDALRVIVTDATSFSVELDYSDGDSVYSYIPQGLNTGTQTTATVNGTDVIAAVSAKEFNRVIVYSEGLAGVTVAGAVKVQVSPYDSGSVFVDLGLTLTSGTAGNVTLTAITNVVARRIKLVSTTAPTGGSVTYSMILSTQ